MILAILQARMSSTRLPGKVMRPLLGEPMIGRQIERIQRAREFDKLVVATTTERDDDGLATYVGSLGVEVHRGTLDDVLGRFHTAIERWRPDHVVRLTADCPLTDWNIIDACIRLHIEESADYTSNVFPPTFPDGLDVEVVRASVLAASAAEACQGFDREHVTSFVRARPERFHLANLTRIPDLSGLRWTVDTVEDFTFVERVYHALYPANPAFGTGEVLQYAVET